MIYFTVVTFHNVREMRKTLDRGSLWEIKGLGLLRNLIEEFIFFHYPDHYSVIADVMSKFGKLELQTILTTIKSSSLLVISQNIN